MRMRYREDKRLSRSFLANPYRNIPLAERLTKNNTVDLRDNSVLVCLGNGYSEIKPIDETKLYKP